jgi:hypothetical protein
VDFFKLWFLKSKIRFRHLNRTNDLDFLIWQKVSDPSKSRSTTLINSVFFYSDEELASCLQAWKSKPVKDKLKVSSQILLFLFKYHCCQITEFSAKLLKRGPKKCRNGRKKNGVRKIPNLCKKV